MSAEGGHIAQSLNKRSMQFQLTSEYIELDNLLKVMNFASCGSEAKEAIRKGFVSVNGEVESRLRRKIRAGDCVSIDGQDIRVVQ